MNRNISKLVGVGFGKLRSKFLTGLSSYSGKNFSVPGQVYWNISNRCNFRCRMCPQWNRGLHEREEDYCDFNQMRNLIDQMKELKIKNFGISGGEPLLRKKLLFDVLEYANSQGIYTHFGTNGWLLDEETIRKYDAIGGGHISLSIDGIEKTHDSIRGVQGAFDHAIKALERYKKVNPQNISMKINTVMTRENLDEIVNVIELAESHGSSIFIQPFDNLNYDQKYEHSGTVDDSLWVGENSISQVEKIVEEIMKIKKEKRGLILNSSRHLESFCDYFSNRFAAGRTCTVAYKNFSVDPFGDVIPCGFLGAIGNIKENSIEQIWNSELAEKARKKASACKQNCMQGCFFEPGIFEMIRDGFFYAKKLLKKRN